MYYCAVMSRFKHSRRSRSLIGVTMLVLVFARALIPAGVMLGQDNAGTLTLIRCPGVAQAGAAVHHQHEQNGDAARWQGSCLFAVSDLTAPPPQAFLAGLWSGRPAALVATNEPWSPPIPSILRAQSPRAPPVPA